MTIWRVNVKEKDIFGVGHETDYRLTPEAYARVQQQMVRCCSNPGDDCVVTVTAKNGRGMTLISEGMAWTREAMRRFEAVLMEALEQSYREEVF